MFQSEHVPGFTTGCIIVDPRSTRMTDEILQHMITLALWGYSLRGELINDSNTKKKESASGAVNVTSPASQNK